MNIFRLIGDLMHIASIFILCVKIYGTGSKSCKGISLKSQGLYLLVFLCRYMDLFTNHISAYNTIMKILFIASSAFIVYLMRFKEPFCSTYDAKSDFFFVPYIIVPCAILALLTYEYPSVMEIAWTFSIYLEAVAIIPQILVVHSYAKQDQGFVENISAHYVFTLGAYRAFYLFNWIYRFFTEPGYRDWVVWISGTVQTLIYCDFFYYYVIAATTGSKMSLPI